ncbi:MAG: type II toxin-antitoxin system RelE/ParE family toxin [Rhodospirillales bacterium]|nr:type II toxin-antitoxin system RelE/ParE family toxin [Rhodospirillales bacterium]
MEWAVLLHPEFDPEFDALPEGVQDELLAALRLLRVRGPALGRPTVDTLKGSTHANMKELRIRYRGKPWRFLFAFDPARAAVVLAGGDKTGDGRFYGRTIRIADRRFARHLRTAQRIRS